MAIIGKPVISAYNEGVGIWVLCFVKPKSNDANLNSN